MYVVPYLMLTDCKVLGRYLSRECYSKLVSFQQWSCQVEHRSSRGLKWHRWGDQSNLVLEKGIIPPKTNFEELNRR